MCHQREKQREIGDDYIPGNKCGLSTAGMEMLSGVAVTYGLGDVQSDYSLCVFHPSVYLCVYGPNKDIVVNVGNPIRNPGTEVYAQFP